MTFQRAKSLPYTLLLLVLWISLAAIVDPSGDFPLNDDFSFGKSVYNLSEKGVILFDDWLSMTLVVQVLWGGLFAGIFGFSFTILRISTLVLGAVAIVTCYFLYKNPGTKKESSFLAGLVLLANPLFFSLSYTYMTDIPFLAFCTLSVFCFIRAIESNRVQWVVMGTVAALGACFIRQLGLMIPIAFSAVWLIQHKWTFRNWLLALLPLLLSLFLLFLYIDWFTHHQGLPETFGTIDKLFKRLDDDNFAEITYERTGLLLMYTGLFLLPLLIRHFRVPATRWAWFGTVLAVIIIGTAMVRIQHRFPWGNIFYNLGLGPKTLKDGIFFIHVSPTLSKGAVQIIALLAILSGALLVINLLTVLSQKLKKGNKSFYPTLFLLLNVIIYTGFLMLDVYFFDRYFLPLLFFFLLLLSPQASGSEQKPGPLVKTMSYLTLLGLGLFSIAATHDYLSWNRARWEALDELTEVRDIPPGRIDGGFEFNGWHKPGPIEYGKAKSWWWVERDDFVVTFGEMEGFEVETVFPFRTWLPPGKDSIYVLKKVGIE